MSMKNLVLLLVVGGIFTSCSKTVSDSTEEMVSTVTQKKPEVCDFGSNNFSLSKRAPVNDGFDNKPPRGGISGGGGGTVTPPPPAGSVILLDFDGHYLAGSAWNYNGPMTLTPANLTGPAIANIVNRVINDYSPFNVVVTTSETVFNAANPYKRMRVVITESWEWYGQVGGTAFIGSFTWGDTSPCFVFSSLLGYGEKFISEAISHEAGHTFGLYHQATYSGGTMTSAYNYGYGSGETGWAPIMGCGYYQNLTLWHNGPNTYGANSFQNDGAIINGVVGSVADDYGNSTSTATTLSTTLNGVINSETDQDYFYVNLSTAKTLSIIPNNVGAGNSGANVDINLRIFNAQGTLLATVNDPNYLQAITSLSAGSYYISVGVTPNTYSATYGMLGKYTISLN